MQLLEATERNEQVLQYLDKNEMELLIFLGKIHQVFDFPVYNIILNFLYINLYPESRNIFDFATAHCKHRREVDKAWVSDLNCRLLWYKQFNTCVAGTHEIIIS